MSGNLQQRIYEMALPVIEAACAEAVRNERERILGQLRDAAAELDDAADERRAVWIRALIDAVRARGSS